MTMQEYWKEVHDKALDGMRMLVSVLKNDKVEDNCEDMECALAYVMRHGTCKMKAKAMGCFFDYKWAAHEIKAHSMAPSGAQTKVM